MTLTIQLSGQSACLTSSRPRVDFPAPLKRKNVYCEFSPKRTLLLDLFINIILIHNFLMHYLFCSDSGLYRTRVCFCNWHKVGIPLTLSQLYLPNYRLIMSIFSTDIRVQICFWVLYLVGLFDPVTLSGTFFISTILEHDSSLHGWCRHYYT